MSDTALKWFKSTYSGSEGGQCVEVAQVPTAIHIRDSKAPQGHVTVAPDAWAAFLGALDA
ncbi:DUF397 domain-containing protein [Streptomyces sp. PU10]|uniref:DUF397 domain-containing protein n=1 Tax=unclassified Streptomyces TaxID=2593676 RepID=UPI0018D6D832|nr:MULTISPECIES: DUF397 domain-containing protein [unclassified Streptomyces]MBH5133243.1 DUF397 domain-containing protein [Streptomyces sp. HB-N217]MDU0257035.1 DUF397 domain-containing protein [Streptomyces sp. PU10]WSU00522.1 DUF397 domain-containing protein [Streptomyces sp. NBC_01124]